VAFGFRKSLSQQQPTTIPRAQYININNDDIVISETMRDGHTRTATRPRYIPAAVLNRQAGTLHLLDTRVCPDLSSVR